jgi:hypothetical protein
MHPAKLCYKKSPLSKPSTPLLIEDSLNQLFVFLLSLRQHFRCAFFTFLIFTHDFFLRIESKNIQHVPAISSETKYPTSESRREILRLIADRPTCCPVGSSTEFILLLRGFFRITEFFSWKS